MKDNYTHLALIVDRSGSMQSIASDVNGAIQHLLGEQAALDGILLVDVCTFDSVVEFPYTDARVGEIGTDLVAPRGMTALNDAIGLMIVRLGNKFKTMHEDHRPAHVIVVIATDGMENSSREYTSDQVKAMVKVQQDEWNWTFIYLAANVDAFATGGAYGMGVGQTISVAGSGQSFAAAYGATSNLVTRTRTGGSSEYTEEEREAAGTD